MGMFSGIKEAKESVQGVYVVPGKFRFKLNRLKTGENRKEEKFFVAELKILESNVSERPVGSECSWMVMKKHDAYLPNVKGFLRIVFQSLLAQRGQPVVEVEIEEATAEEACGEENPCAGVEVDCEATNKKTATGGDFTVCRWQVTYPKKAAKAA